MAIVFYRKGYLVNFQLDKIQKKNQNLQVLDYQARTLTLLILKCLCNCEKNKYIVIQLTSLEGYLSPLSFYPCVNRCLRIRLSVF